MFGTSTRFLFLATAASILAACHSEQQKPKTASQPAAASTVSTPATKPATASEATASTASTALAASASAASAAQGDAQTPSSFKNAKWQDYHCDESKTLKARYAGAGKAAEAQVQFKNQTFTLKFDAASSNEDLVSFSDGKHSWTIGNEHNGDYYREDFGFLVHRELLDSTDKNSAVDSTLVQNCSPKP